MHDHISEYLSLAEQLGDPLRSPRGMTSEEAPPPAPAAPFEAAVVRWGLMTPATPRSYSGVPESDLVIVRLARGTFLGPATMDAPPEEFVAPALLRVTRDDAASLQRAQMLAS